MFDIANMMNEMKFMTVQIWIKADEEVGNQFIEAFKEGAGLADSGWSEDAIAHFSSYVASLLENITASKKGDDNVFYCMNTAQGVKKINDACGYIGNILSHNDIPYRIEVGGGMEGEESTVHGDYTP